MQCFVLGSGGMMPMPKRRLTSVAVRTGGWVYLFDCGEGTQVPYKELHIGQRALRMIAISHLHADHCLGLPGMLMLRAQMPNPSPLDIFGPPGLGAFVNHVRKDLALYINYEIRIHHWEGKMEQGDSPSLAYEDELVRISWQPLNHTTFCLGYRLEEHTRPGKFNPEAAKTLGLPPGPTWGALQRGENVTTEEGDVVEPKQVLGPPRSGRRIAFVTDTLLTNQMRPLLKEVDVAFVESMFLEEHLEEAFAKKHMTARQAATAGAEAGARRLVLVHISPRYEGPDLLHFIKQASPIFPGVSVARDGEVIEVPLAD